MTADQSTDQSALPEVEFELFSSSFCGACDATRALLEQVMRVLPTVRVREHNVAQSLDLANSLDITVTPTVIVRDADGIELTRAAGVPTINHLLVAAEKAMGRDSGSEPTADDAADPTI